MEILEQARREEAGMSTIDRNADLMTLVNVFTVKPEST